MIKKERERERVRENERKRDIERERDKMIAWIYLSLYVTYIV